MTTGIFVRVIVVISQILLLLSAASTAGAELSWTRCSPLPTDAFHFGVDSHDSIAVAVGEGGSIVISTDSGANWHVVEAPVQSRLFKVLWSGTQFIAVGSNGTVITSPDGIQWESQESGVYFNEIYSIAFNGTRYVATGESGLIIESKDGKTWNPCESGTSRYLFDVIWDGNRFIAVGGRYFESGSDSGTILISTDGLSWETQVDSLTGCFQGVATNGTVHVAVSDAGIIYRSTADQPWTAQSTVAPYAFRGVINDDTSFIAFGELGMMYWSPDGSSWTQKDAPFSKKVRGMTICADSYIAVGESGLIISSTDGENWILHLKGTLAWLNDCIWTGSAFIAIGKGGTLVRSTDGTSWESLPSPSKVDLDCIAWDGTNCIVNDGIMFYSTRDFIHWNSVNVPIYGPTVLTLTCAGSRFVAAGFTFIALSTDGENWQIADSGLHAQFWDATWTGSEFILVGATYWDTDDPDTGLVATSPDGLSWNLTRVDSYKGVFYSVAWTGTQVVTTGVDRKLYVSDDFKNWHEYTYSVLNGNLQYYDSTLYACGRNGAILSTTNFNEWKNHSLSTSSYVSALCFSPTQIIAVGSDGIIYRANFESQNSVRYSDRYHSHSDITRCIQSQIRPNEFDALGRKVQSLGFTTSGIRFHKNAKNTLILRDVK